MISARANHRMMFACRRWVIVLRLRHCPSYNVCRCAEKQLLHKCGGQSQVNPEELGCLFRVETGALQQLLVTQILFANEVVEITGIHVANWFPEFFQERSVRFRVDR